jgi:hypothetical protein
MAEIISLLKRKTNFHKKAQVLDMPFFSHILL